MRGSSLVALTLALISSQAFAASRVWIAEFTTAKVAAPAPFASLPAFVIQAPLDIAAGVKTSAAFGAQTRYIRIVCEVQCALNGSGSAASANDVLIPALRPEYFGVAPGKTISVIAAP